MTRIRRSCSTVFWSVLGVFLPSATSALVALSLIEWFGLFSFYTAGRNSIPLVAMAAVLAVWCVRKRLPRGIVPGVLVGSTALVLIYAWLVLRMNKAMRVPDYSLAPEYVSDDLKADADQSLHLLSVLEKCSAEGPMRPGRRSRPRLMLKESELTWDSSQREVTLLRGSDGAILLVMHYSCSFLHITDSLAAIWADKVDRPGIIACTFINTEFLTPLSNPDMHSQSVRERSSLWRHNAGYVMKCVVDTSRAPGDHDIECIGVIDWTGAIAIHYSSTNAAMYGDLCLSLVWPRRGTMRVASQDWWNQGSFKKSYEFVSRMVWDAKTGRVIGEGSRIRAFVLDQSLTRVASFLE